MKVVFATETLSLGINMPARSVVIEKLSKFTGEHHEFLTPGEYTQLTGRAGRRGIDDVGYAVVCWSPFVPFDQVAGLASRRTYALTSSFRPTYNMAANLVARYPADVAHHLLNLSFAQYRADRDVVALERQLERNQELAGPPAGRRDLRARRRRVEYRELLAARDDARRLPGAGAACPTRIDALRPGDVLTLRRGGGRAVVLKHESAGRGGAAGARARREPGGLPARPPRTSTGRRARSRTSSCRSRTRPAAPRTARASWPRCARSDAVRRRRVRNGEHERRETPSWRRSSPSTRWPTARSSRCTSGPRARPSGSSATSPGSSAGCGAGARAWPASSTGCCACSSRGGTSTAGRSPTRGTSSPGCTPRRDLLLAEALRTGLLDGTTVPELAALVSCFTYEHRGPEDAALPPVRWPSSRVAKRAREMERLWRDLSANEDDAGLPETRTVDPGLVEAMHAWAAGESLADVLEDDEDLTGGDFVRHVKQVVDLLHQVADVAPDPETAAPGPGGRRRVLPGRRRRLEPPPRHMKPGEPWGEPLTDAPDVEVAGDDAGPRGGARAPTGATWCGSSPAGARTSPGRWDRRRRAGRARGADRRPRRRAGRARGQRGRARHRTRPHRLTTPSAHGAGRGERPPDVRRPRRTTVVVANGQFLDGLDVVPGAIPATGGWRSRSTPSTGGSGGRCAPASRRASTCPTRDHDRGRPRGRGPVAGGRLLP